MDLTIWEVMLPHLQWCLDISYDRRYARIPTIASETVEGDSRNAIVRAA